MPHAAPSPGHDPGLSSLEVRLAPARVEAELTLAGADFALGPGRGLDRDGDGAIVAGELAAAGARELAAWLEIVVGEQPVAWETAVARVAADGDVVIALAGGRPAGAGVGLCVPALRDLPHGHRQFVVVTDGAKVLGQALLAANAPAARWGAATTAKPAAVGAVLAAPAGAVDVAPRPGFELGVVLGALVLAAALLVPLWVVVRRRVGVRARRLTFATSAAVLACGLCWLLELLP